MYFVIANLHPVEEVITGFDDRSVLADTTRQGLSAADDAHGSFSIGAETVKEWGMLTENEKTLYVLTPTQTVKDRLVHYFYWHDAQCLDQAVWAAKQQLIDFENVRAWSLRENNIKKFQDFLDELGA